MLLSRSKKRLKLVISSFWRLFILWLGRFLLKQYVSKLVYKTYFTMWLYMVLWNVQLFIWKPKFLVNSRESSFIEGFNVAVVNASTKDMYLSSFWVLSRFHSHKGWDHSCLLKCSMLTPRCRKSESNHRSFVWPVSVKRDICSQFMSFICFLKTFQHYLRWYIQRILV